MDRKRAQRCFRAPSNSLSWAWCTVGVSVLISDVVCCASVTLWSRNLQRGHLRLIRHLLQNASLIVARPGLAHLHSNVPQIRETQFLWFHAFTCFFLYSYLLYDFFAIHRMRQVLPNGPFRSKLQERVLPEVFPMYILYINVCVYTSSTCTRRGKSCLGDIYIYTIRHFSSKEFACAVR